MSNKTWDPSQALCFQVIHSLSAERPREAHILWNIFFVIFKPQPFKHATILLCYLSNNKYHSKCFRYRIWVEGRFWGFHEGIFNLNRSLTSFLLYEFCFNQNERFKFYFPSQFIYFLFLLSILFSEFDYLPPLFHLSNFKPQMKENVSSLQK